MATSSTNIEGNNNNSWSWEQDKAFETGIAMYPENCEERWEKIANQIPGHKTPQQVKHHYQLLLDDIASIESGQVNLPNYPCKSRPSTLKKSGKGKMSEWERRRGHAWTEEEHKLFLRGMEKYGKGDWKTIAKEFVKTRTSTQVASHAQKHFKRQEKRKKVAKRWSIFDITSPVAGTEAGIKAKSKNNVISSVSAREVPTMLGGSSGTYGVDTPVSPPLSPPLSWCLEGHDDGFMDSAYQECLSQLPPL